MSRLKLTLIISTTLAVVSIVLIQVFKIVFVSQKVEPVRYGYCGNATRYTRSDSVNLSGKFLFKANCAACHNDPEKNIKDGFPLTGSLTRSPGREWMYAFIQNSDSVIKSGEPYANQLLKNYSGVRQPLFPNLTKKDIDAILDYCDADK